MALRTNSSRLRPRPWAIRAGGFVLLFSLASVVAADSPATGAKKETYVELPGRGENIPVIAGVNFGAADTPAPKAKAKTRPGKATLLKDDPLPAQLPDGWEEFVQPAKNYSLWIPASGRKVSSKHGMMPIKTLKIRYNAFLCEIEDDVTVEILVLGIPLQKGEQIDRVTLYETFRDMYVTKSEGEVTQEFNTNIGKVPGKEYRVDLGGDKLTRLRTLAGPEGTTLIYFQVAVTGTKEQVEGEAAKRVLSSFKHRWMLVPIPNPKTPPKKK